MIGLCDGCGRAGEVAECAAGCRVNDGKGSPMRPMLVCDRCGTKETVTPPPINRSAWEALKAALAPVPGH